MFSLIYRTVLLFAIACLFVRSAAIADNTTTDNGTQTALEFGAFVGGTFLSTDLELGDSVYADQVPGDALATGLRFGIAFFPSSQPLDLAYSLEIEARAAFSSTQRSTQRQSHFTPVLGWRGHAKFTFLSSNRLSPFVVVGGGADSLTKKRSPFVRQDIDGSFHWGIGAQYLVSAPWSIRLDARHFLSGGRVDNISHNWESFVSVQYSLPLHRRKRDRNEPPKMGQKIFDHSEQPPQPPESDKDADGIVDAKDKCPLRAELVNGVDDTDGCPEMDMDGDGILGSQDGCPSKAEDVDQFEDTDGCPDMDNDKDNIADHQDKCPVHPETVNGFRDGDGCPDDIPTEIQQLQVVFSAIHFSSGSAKLSFAAKKRLSQVVRTLQQHPTIRIRIEGHTDNRGSQQNNLRLSSARANAVKIYCVEKGIWDDRIETIGLGPSKPIASNESAAGRKDNRRIEVHLIPVVPQSQ